MLIITPPFYECTGSFGHLSEHNHLREHNKGPMATEGLLHNVGPAMAKV